MYSSSIFDDLHTCMYKSAHNTIDHTTTHTHTHLLVHLIPSLREALDGRAGQGDGDVEGAVHVVVVVARPGDLDKGFDHCRSGRGGVPREDLSAHPGGHLGLGRGERGRGREEECDPMSNVWCVVWY